MQNLQRQIDRINSIVIRLNLSRQKSDYMESYADKIRSLGGLRLHLGANDNGSGGWLDETGQSSFPPTGTPVLTKSGAFSYWAYGGSDAHVAAAAARWNILGNEAYIAPADRGLTIICWANLTAHGGVNHSLIDYTNGSSAAGSSYQLAALSSGVMRFGIYSGGSGYNVDATFSEAAPHFLAARFDPVSATRKTQLRIDETEQTNATSIPATLNSSANSWRIGNSAGGVIPAWVGWIAQITLFARRITDAETAELYRLYRVVMGV